MISFFKMIWIPLDMLNGLTLKSKIRPKISSLSSILSIWYFCFYSSTKKVHFIKREWNLLPTRLTTRSGKEILFKLSIMKTRSQQKDKRNATILCLFAMNSNTKMTKFNLVTFIPIRHPIYRIFCPI